MASVSQLRPWRPTDRLESTRGPTRTVSEALGENRGKVTILFYEDRHHVDDNMHLKQLFAQRRSDDVVVIAIANLRRMRMVSALARPVVRSIAERYGIELWMDWRGELLAAPLAFEDDAANVAVLDREGRMVWRATGSLGHDRIQELDDAIASAASRGLLDH